MADHGIYMVILQRVAKPPKNKHLARLIADLAELLVGTPFQSCLPTFEGADDFGRSGELC